MKALQQGDSYVITVDLGEELTSSIVRFASQEKIEAAAISAIGAVRDFELGYYRLSDQEYTRKRFTGIAELISCLGNLAIRDGKPFPHLHVSVGFEDFTTAGGHFFLGIVAVTAEVLIRPLPKRMERKHDQQTGLALLDLPVWKAF
jgi:uncharacterized protein